MKTIIISALALLNYSLQAQQAWTKDKGKFYTQIGGTLHFYDSKVNLDNSVSAIDRKVNNNTLQAYFEYGITNKLTITTTLPFVLTNSKNTETIPPIGVSNGKLNALGNVDLGLTYNICKKNSYVVAVKLNTNLPTASFQTASGLRTGVNALAVGPSILWGYGSSKFFTSAEFGFKYRTNKYSSQTIGGFQIGKNFGAKQNLIGIFHTDISSSNYDGTYDDKNSFYTVSYLNNQTYFAHGFKFGYKLMPKIMAWVDVRAGSYVANVGTNSKPIPGLSFAISYNN
jgi:hypothetical protein